MKKFFAAFICLVIIFIISIVYLFERPGLNQKESKVEELKQTSVAKASPTPTPQDTKIILTGDVMLGRNVMKTSLAEGSFEYPFKNVYEVLRSADITFVNLENPVVYDCPVIDSGFTFCSRPASVDGLVYGGVDLVNLANNHTLNFGKKGLDETREILNGKGVLFTGIDELTVVPLKGMQVGFLGFDFTFSEPTEKDYKLIKDSDDKVDLLVVAVHWGVEYEDTPRSFQKEWARIMIKNGADIISGNHPHWIQGAECYKDGKSLGYIAAESLENFDCTGGKPVYYALGNFIFDQMWSEETKKGAIVILSFREKEIVREKVIRSYIPVPGQPKWVTD